MTLRHPGPRHSLRSPCRWAGRAPLKSDRSSWLPINHTGRGSSVYAGRHAEVSISWVKARRGRGCSSTPKRKPAFAGGPSLETSALLLSFRIGLIPRVLTSGKERNLDRVAGAGSSADSTLENMKIPLPAFKAPPHKEPLTRFIWDHEPEGIKASPKFRRQLVRVLNAAQGKRYKFTP